MGSVIGHVSLRVAQWNRKRACTIETSSSTKLSKLMKHRSKLSYRYTGNTSHG